MWWNATVKVSDGNGGYEFRVMKNATASAVTSLIAYEAAEGRLVWAQVDRSGE